MTPRNRALLIVGLVLLLVVAFIVVIVMLLRRVAPPQDAGPIQEPAPIEEPVVGEPKEDFANPLIIDAPATPGRTASQQMAELFAERYGSYSNQGDYQNLRDLLPVMTASYRSETEAYLRTAPVSEGQAYQGVTSVKVSSDVRSVDEGSAVIAVTLQQTRTEGSAVTTGYRTLRMELVQVGDEWFVDDAAWED